MNRYEKLLERVQRAREDLIVVEDELKKEVNLTGTPVALSKEAFEIRSRLEALELRVDLIEQQGGKHDQDD